MLLRLVADADVFVTSLLPGPRSRLRIDVADIRAVNPSIVYARATGYGTRGPEAETPGYDAAASWARAGFAEFLTPSDASQPIPPPGGIGDCVGGLTGAGAVAAALYKRAITGEAVDVDVSLLHTGMWMNATILMMHANAGPEGSQMRRMDRRASPNPLVNSYKTKDGRWLWMVVIQPDPHWHSFCEHLGRPELIDDPRFADFHARMEHNAALIEILDEVFASATLDEWRERLRTFPGVWDVNQTPRGSRRRSAGARERVRRTRCGEPGPPLTAVTSPAQFDNVAMATVRRAPEHGQHTEEVLLEHGYSWDEISVLKEQGAII